MRISEIFHSVQGEGSNVGKPSVFVRFFGCNLACTWCDTKYSWHPKYAEWEEMKLQKIVETILNFGCPHVIFTGGEPALFQKDIRALTEQLPPHYTYEIESNGTIPLTATNDVYEVVNISPKLANSGKNSDLRAVDDAYWYKFVVEGESDIPEILKLREQYGLKKIFLMPQGETQKEQLEKSPRIIELCQKYGFQFSPRLQCLFWNDAKGK